MGMEYVGRFEVRLAGEFEEDALRLQEAVEALGVAAVFAGDEERKQVMVSFGLDATDGLDAMQQVMEVWSGSWSAAFPGLAPSVVSAMRAEPGEAPVPTAEPAPRRALVDDDDALWADVDAQLAAEEPPVRIGYYADDNPEVFE
jgi:hypothetical protein